MTTRSSRDPIADRIACWKQAYDAVLAEIPHGVTTSLGTPVYPPEQWMVELAARTAATLAIGATTRGRGE